MHSEDCYYKDEDALLYALMQVAEDKYILISANEVSVFDDYLEAAKDNDRGIDIDLDTCDKEPYQLVYGSLLFHDIDREKLIEYVNGLKNYALIDLDVEEFGKLTASAYADICLFEECGKRRGSIPFVALMQTLCKENVCTSTTMFPCCNRLVWENMVNRSFLLACRKFVKIDGLTLDNWKSHIDMDVLDKAYQNAELYTGITDANYFK